MSRVISIALACVVLFIAFCSAQAFTETQLRDQFGSFIVKYERDYATDIEFETRFQIFKANVLEAQKYQEQSRTATFGVTKFSDWTHEERRAYLGKLPQQRSSWAAAPSKTAFKAPTSFDFQSKGLTPPVKDQGSCGSCWAFSTVFGISSAALTQGLAQSEVDYSQQQVVDCCEPKSQCAGCNGGDLPPAFDSLKAFGGIVSAKNYPYTARTGTCHANSTDISIAVTGYEFVIPTCEYSDCERVDSQQFLARLQEENMSASICVQATNAWFSYKSGLFDLTCGGDYYDLNHCVGGIIEYNAEEGYVSIQNSWGESWGMEGLMRLKYDPSVPKYNNPCGIFSEGAFAKVSPKK